MTQQFVFGQPVPNSVLASIIVQKNLDSLGTTNEGTTAPLNPQKGMLWLDTSGAPASTELKYWDGAAWQAIASFPLIAPPTGIVRISVSPAVQTWTLIHNFGKSSVDVTLFDLAGKTITPLDVDITNINQAVIQHAAPLEGAALLVG